MGNVFYFLDLCRREEMFLYAFGGSRKNFQVRCCWDFNGSDQSTKSSSWRKHMWFLEIWDEVGESNETRCFFSWSMSAWKCTRERLSRLPSQGRSYFKLCLMLSLSFPLFYQHLEKRALLELLTENTSGTIKEQLATIAPVLEQLWQQKEERIKEFLDAQGKKQRLHKVMHLEHFFSLIFIYAIVVKYISSQMLGILIYCGFCLANRGFASLPTGIQLKLYKLIISGSEKFINLESY
ncbi:65-kDa microtubule-associated protein 1 [Glycine soja]